MRFWLSYRRIFTGIVSSVIAEIYQRSSVVLPVSAILALWSRGKQLIR